MNHNPDSESDKQEPGQGAPDAQAAPQPQYPPQGAPQPQYPPQGAPQPQYPPPPQYQPQPQFAPQATPAEPSVVDRLLLALKFQPGAYTEIAADPASLVRGLIIVVVASILGFWRLCPGFGDGVEIMLSLAIMIAFPVSLVAFSGYLNFGIRLLLRDSQTDSSAFLPSLRAFLFTWAPVALGTTIPIAGLLVGVLFAAALQVFAVKDLYKVPVGDALMLWITALPVAAILALLNIVVLVGSASVYYAYSQALALISKVGGTLGTVMDLLDRLPW